ncbi:acyl-homoserine-lactone synthase [Parasulfitobacter algicola]|uniref:Acyl-homoserine-lactone synthase n=1 Tax=Parasulfitobacter algicola TaxID=2614809 RepID=A0ABX2IZK5_9RHOB|nr:acyl-homoserine-lactone synthase [Sulfitobacter algicola]NSX56845.1 autoinducer synthase [Sulfitobacter algicola]
MLRFIYGKDLTSFPKLRTSMFQDRACQFRDRLGWDVKVGRDGAERDQYDYLNPLYVIWQKPDGKHGGSMRALPTTGRTMLNEHFNHIIDKEIKDAKIWECTRFCLSRDADAKTAAMLVLGGAQMGLRYDLDYTVGVFDARMEVIYRRLGWQPQVLGSQGKGRDKISVGIWPFSLEIRDKLCDKIGVPSALISSWVDQSIGSENPASATG